MYKIAFISALMASMCGATTFNFLRHAQGIHNAPPEGYAKDMSVDPDFRDPQLTTYGQQQALMRRADYGTMTFDAIYTSPMRRCKQTLLGVYPQASVRNVMVDDRLIEQPSGRHIADMRLERADIIESSPHAWDFSAVAELNPFHSGNATVDTDNLKTFTRDVKEKFPDGNVLVVAHSNLIWRWFNIFKGRDVYLNNCEMISTEL